MLKRTVISQLTFGGCCLALMVSMLSASALAQSSRTTEQPEQNLGFEDLFSRNTAPRISTRPVAMISDGSVIPATGTLLIRNRDSVYAEMHTHGLTPGTVVTFWLGIFNYPINCATSPCTPADFANPAVQGSVVNGGGKIIGADGTATYGTFRAIGDTTGVGPLGVGLGLLNPFGAEIHLVTRQHGAAILNDPAALAQQLSQFNGGCPPNTCSNVQASPHQP
jgi:hypothetical protein